MILSETITHVLKLLAQSTTQRIFFARKKYTKPAKNSWKMWADEKRPVRRNCEHTKWFCGLNLFFIIKLSQLHQPIIGKGGGGYFPCKMIKWMSPSKMSFTKYNQETHFHMWGVETHAYTSTIFHISRENVRQHLEHGSYAIWPDLVNKKRGFWLNDCL